MSGAVAVADSWAVLAFLRGEGPAAVSMRRYLRRSGSRNLRLLLNWINLGEVYYRIAQIRGFEGADKALDLIRDLPIELYPVLERLVLEAARLKSKHALSYDDAFAVATARLEGAFVITGDPEILNLPRDVVTARRIRRS